MLLICLPFNLFRNKDDITKERLSLAKVLILAGPREKFKVTEVIS